MSVIAKIRTQINELHAQIDAIQRMCSHPPIVLQVETDEVCLTPDYDALATKQYRKTTYFKCELCEKSWSESEVSA